MNLVIDCGNTCTKVAVFDFGELKEKFVYSSLELADIEHFFVKFDIQRTIVSSVGTIKQDVLHELERRTKSFIFLDQNTPLPINNMYESKNTLGRDRIAVAVGANFLCSNRNVLIIDAGTAITYEFVDENNVYQGGSISPGLGTRLKSLHEFTKQLPLVEPKEIDMLYGKDTETAILTGVVNGVTFEIEGYINRFKEKYDNLFVFLTGGTAFFFERKLKSIIFASPNLLLIGLNRILNYNECIKTA